VAQVNGPLVFSGILHGVSTAVAGGLIAEQEALEGAAYLPQARSLAAEVIARSERDLADWQQIMVGEVVGTAVAARTFAGTLGDLQLENVSDLIQRIWEIIDRF
jgi:hypothetical protein